MIKLNLELDETSRLVRFANKMCGFYGHPVYLVGSQLTSETPRDVDLICIIPDEEFKMRWFPDWWTGSDDPKEAIEKFYLGIHTGIHKEEHWHWYQDMKKQSLFGMKGAHLPIDFKIQAESYSVSHYIDSPKKRLDTRPY